ncbi:MAG TPA: hypothetical protein DCL49_08750 [Candidatus Omnitrophica bacterium]|nr:hypothetical protein [Candidatus Omnitrophota bacterium]HBG63718.1 hypothetical protein [Candidatus Omnitrophota bacterium]HCD39184.1 hypothetical protein [Candidatus Omnitrophota bacterium]
MISQAAAANFAMKKSQASGVRIAIVLAISYQLSAISCFSQGTKEPSVAGQFYPQDKNTLSRQIESFLDNAHSEPVSGNIFCLIVPHAGYAFSGQAAAFAYALIKDKPYKTVVVIGPSHHWGINGISVYREGTFRTPLGDLEIDSAFSRKLINPAQGIDAIPAAFEKEHSVEVQLPFLQSVLKDFKIVPVLVGDCSFRTLGAFADNLAATSKERSDVLVVVSTDLCHSYDYEETQRSDRLTLSYLERMDAEDIYDNLNKRTIQMCGGFPAVAGIIAAKHLGATNYRLLRYTHSAEVTGNKAKGVWTVGYASALLYTPILEKNTVYDNQALTQGKKGGTMLTTQQKKKLLDIARATIEAYVTSGKRLTFTEDDQKLRETNGAFVTLHSQGALRGCIGTIIGQKPLYETIRDMAIESSSADPRFPAVTKLELKDIDIEISVLSPLQKIASIDEFVLGTHGVLVRQGFQQGVFLPQVAAETGWTKEEFLSNLCLHKAGLSPKAWQDPKTELFIFSAEIFSEKELR